MNATKQTISKDDVLRHQGLDLEKHSVFGAKPTQRSGAPTPVLKSSDGQRTELDRFFAFDDAAPETINGRRAMLGFVWAFLAERATGLMEVDQILNPSTSCSLFFLGVVQLFTYASLVLMWNGESTDPRKWGPFNGKAERLAMIGFASLMITRKFSKIAIFSKFL